MSIKINSTNTNIAVNSGGQNRQKDNSQKDSLKVNQNSNDRFISTPKERSVVYTKASKNLDTATIERLKAESKKSYEHLERLVKQLLGKQGLTLQDSLDYKGNIDIDEETRIEANALISDGGFLSPESVSDRIVDFAKAISNGDISMLEKLRAAIQKGFDEAARILGGTLPEVSHKTYDLIMEKLNKWSEKQ